ncbi:MAG: hypothetical protein [Caudoviricetes sp.]|nr:MAG: hypothetical protein [Caudoviricetes sp.]
MAVVITKQPAAVTIKEGEKLSLSVTATGTNVTYQWKKNDADISGKTGASLTVTSAKPSDSGTYTVMVKDDEDEKLSDPAIVKVNAKVLPKITTQPSDVTVTEGDAIELKVVATGATSYQWKKDDVDLPSQTKATFGIASSALTDAGSYTVVVTNDDGSVTSNPAVVKVDAKVVPPTDDRPVYLPWYLDVPKFAFVHLPAESLAVIRKDDSLDGDDAYIRGIKKAVAEYETVVAQDSRNGYFHKFTASEMTFDIGSMFDRKKEFVF